MLPEDAVCVQKPAPPPPPPPPPPRNPIQSSSSGSCSAQVYYGAPWNSIYVLPYMSIIRVVRLTATSRSFCDPVQISIYSSGVQFQNSADLCQPSVVCTISKVLHSRCRIPVGWQEHRSSVVCVMQTVTNLDTVDIYPPYALQMWNPYYKYAAQALNWEPSSMANGAIYGNVTQVRTALHSSRALQHICNLIPHEHLFTM